MKTWSEFQEKIWDAFSNYKDNGKGIETFSLPDCVDILKKLCVQLIPNVDEKLLANKENKDVIGDLDTFGGKLKDVSEAYYAGDIKGAVENMKDLLFDGDCLSFLPVNEDIVKKDKFFYRMRKNDKYELYKPKEMFHIPLNKRNVINNQRYSINGFPCLYLGTSLYVCWEETRRPDLDKVNYVAMQYVKSKPLKLLDIGVYEEINDIKKLKSVLLSILCSMEVKEGNDNDSFKKEYVFPELVLHSLIDFNASHKNNIFDGVVYLSAKFHSEKCEYKGVQSIMKNIVLPTRTTAGEYCKELASMFSMSKTSALFMERIYGRSFCSIRTRPTEYTGSLFNLIENDLKVGRDKFERIK